MCVVVFCLLLIAFMVVVVVGFRPRPLWTRWAPTICKNGVITSLTGLISGFSWGYFTPINAAVFAPTVTTGDFNTGHALQIPCVVVGDVGRWQAKESDGTTLLHWAAMRDDVPLAVQDWL